MTISSDHVRVSSELADCSLVSTGDSMSHGNGTGDGVTVFAEVDWCC